MEQITRLLSVYGESLDDGLSITYDIGDLHSITLLEDAVLLVKFQYGEIRVTLSLEQIKQLQDENGTKLLGEN